MRNLKKILALVLALVMTFSVMVTANAFTDDANIDPTFEEAVAVLDGLKVFQGFEDGSFGPKGTITRAQVAAIIYRIVTGDVEDKQVGIYADYNKFTDVDTKAWYAGYVNFCANALYIQGYGDGKFGPNDPVTGYAALAMIQRAMGYDKNGEFTGAGWEVRTASNAQALGITKNITAGTLGAPATREMVAEILFQAMQLPTVSYTLAFGYRASGDKLIAKFGAVKVEGIIVDTLASKGTTTFEWVEGNTAKTETVKKTEADWTNVGYAGFVWEVKGNAITKTFITGVELGSSNDGTSYADLTNSKKDAYIAAGIDNPALFEDGAKVRAIDNGIGANLSLVDNDGDGKVDTLVNVTYDVAKVTNVTRISKSGVVTDYSYSLDTNKVIYPKELANVDSLAKGDYIAYTVVDDEYYVTVLSADKGEFEYIDSTELKAETVKCYSIAGTEYVVSEMDGVATNGQLLKSNINNDVVFVTDMFGYIVRVEAPKADPNDYLYVIDNEHSKVLTGLAETYIANVDGSVDTVNVKDKTLSHSELKGEIFTYTVKNDAYVLGAAEYVTLDVAAYETFEVSMTGIADLSETTIVDLRDVLAAKADEGTVYVGYTEIPSFVDGKILYIPEIDLGFMTAGKAPAAAGVAVEYVVFNTAANVIDRVKVDGVYENTYELKAGVLIKGELVADYVLSQEEKDNVDTFGVGVYSYDKNGVLTYTSFAENTEVKWTPESNGTVIYKNVDVIAAETYEIIILDISAGKIGAWEQLVLEGNYYSYIDDKNDIMYVVGDAPVLTAASKSILAVAGAAGTGAVNGANEYWADNKKVTAYKVLPEAPKTYDVTLVDLVDGLSITADKTTDLVDGTVVTLTVSVDAGYIMQPYYVTANNVLQTAVSENTYAITINGADVTVELDGAADLINCVVNSVDGVADTATLTRKAGSEWVMPYGSTYSFEVEADAGYEISAVKANDTVLTADNGVYSFVVTANTVIYVETEAQEFTVTFEYYMDNNLIVANTQKTTIKAGAEKDVILGTDDAYSYVVDGVIYAAKAPYTLTGITKDTTVEVVVYGKDDVAAATPNNIADLIANADGDTLYLDGTVDLGGAQGAYFAMAKDVTIIGGTIKGTGWTGELNYAVKATSGNIVFDGVTFDTTGWTTVGWAQWGMSVNVSGTANVTFKNCTFKGPQCPIYQSGADSVITLENCKFDTTSVAIQCEIYSGDFTLGQDLIIKNCDFTGVADVLHIYDYDKDPSSAAIAAYLTANGNTFTGICKQTCN